MGERFDPQTRFSFQTNLAGIALIPLHDNIPARTVPIVNYAMIGICTLAFLGQLADQKDGKPTIVEEYSMIPARVLHPDKPIVQPERVPVVDRFGNVVRIVEQPRVIAAPPISPWFTLLTCIFLHGGWMHFLSNMWFLHLFGDNVEDRMGHLGYLLFYLFCGVAASVSHLVSAPSSEIPTVGASGAIAGVMGAYLLLYPHARVVSLLPIFFFIEIIVLPAPIFLGIWFFLQFIQGVTSIMSIEVGGVAWWAHIGGFAVGYLIAALLRGVGETRPAVEKVLPHTDHTSMYRYHRER